MSDDIIPIERTPFDKADMAYARLFMFLHEYAIYGDNAENPLIDSLPLLTPEERKKFFKMLKNEQ